MRHRCWRLLRKYLREHAGQICLYIGILVIFQVVFFLHNIRTDAVRYGCFLTVGWMALYGGIGFARFYKRCRELEENQTAILTDISRMPEAAGQLEAQYQEIIEQLYSRMRELESAGRISRQEMLDYYGMWVHQIKTPIAALKVMIQSLEEERADLPYVREMKLELFKVEQYVEMVLSYLRMEDMSGDLMFEEYSLDAIVRQAVRKYSRMFILKKIRLDLGPLDHQVLTDEKWLVFVVEQILSNALKYTKEGGISIYMTRYLDRPVLAIEDTGIGISAEDLPRVFEKGFTGYNGRADKKSTGIGLYLCKKIMDRLHHNIYIESQEGQGTKVYLYLEREQGFLQKCKDEQGNVI